MKTTRQFKKSLLLCIVSMMLTACSAQEPAITVQGSREPDAITQTASDSAAVGQPEQAPEESPADVVQSVAPSSDGEEADRQPGDNRITAAVTQLPYYGDPARCTLSAEQALAYARLLADGMLGRKSMTAEGKFPIMDQYITEDAPVCWDLPFAVSGYRGTYETTRSHAILADLAGDGNPYLITYDPEKTTSSCTIWGWANGQVQLLANSENWQGRYSISLNTDNQTGVVSLQNSGSTMMIASSTTYSFGNGGTALAHTWQQEYRPDTDQIVITEDGVSTYYSQEDYHAMMDAQQPADMPAEQYGWPTLEEELADGRPLPELLDILNDYALAVDGASVPVASPFSTEQQQMARSMLHTINHWQYTTQTGENAKLLYVRLLDMDLDGTPELLMGHRDGLYDVKIYRWQNGALSETSSTVYDENTLLADRGALIQDPQTGAYGIQSAQHTDHLVAHYTFVDHREVVDGPIFGPFEMTEAEYAAAQARYDQAAARYQVIEQIYGGEMWQNTDTAQYLEETMVTLSQILESSAS